MLVLYILSACCLLASWLKDKKKTLKALKIAWNRFKRVLPAFGLVVVAVAVILPLLPPEFIARTLGKNNRWLGMMIGTGLGSISMMPGFIAFPLSGLLVSKGVPYMTISAFTTSLMMVGILSFPLEKQYLGVKAALLRNVLSLLVAILVAIATGIVFQEISV